MDKQIMINGVDVAGCGYFCELDNECSICGMGTDGEDTFCKNCKDNSNCYYKKWQRKEQECLELKIYIESNEQQVKEVETLVMDNDRLINELDQLKAENEELKKCYKNNSALLDFEETNTTKLVNKVMKLEQNLTEIKEIAEKMKKMSEEDCGELTECFFKDKQCEKCSEDKCLPYWFNKILQAISESEVNNG